MKVMYHGKEIELEDPTPKEQTMDELTPPEKEQISDSDTLQLYNSLIFEIQEELGEHHE